MSWGGEVGTKFRGSANIKGGRVRRYRVWYVRDERVRMVEMARRTCGDDEEYSGELGVWN